MKVQDAVAFVIRNPEVKAVGLEVESYIELINSMDPKARFVETGFPVKENILIHTRPFFPVYEG